MDSYNLGGQGMPTEIGGSFQRLGAVDRDRQPWRTDAVTPGELAGALHGFRVGGQPIL